MKHSTRQTSVSFPFATCERNFIIQSLSSPVQNQIEVNKSSIYDFFLLLLFNIDQWTLHRTEINICCLCRFFGVFFLLLEENFCLRKLSISRFPSFENLWCFGENQFFIRSQTAKGKDSRIHLSLPINHAYLRSKGNLGETRRENTSNSSYAFNVRKCINTHFPTVCELLRSRQQNLPFLRRL